ncbi:MAG: ATP-binding protein [Verrucomicrobia bacterium]|nr:ATP-binding protein [Verrucomicrobiota bacterium]
MNISPVWKLCTIKPKALDIRVSNQIANLQDAITDLEQGMRFFANTHLTGGLKELMQEGLSRLSGRSQQSVFLLKQAMGGGKTHLLVAMGLLARHQELRKTICPELFKQFPFEQAAVATFNGRNANTWFWQEIAQQLDKNEIFKKATLHTPPDERSWLEVFADNKPYLILLDELPPYIQHHGAIPSGNGSQADLLVQSLASLLTAASKKNNVCVILSDLDAAYGEGSKGIGAALRNLQQEAGRQAKTITPVDLTGQEIYAILKKNLFEKLPNEESIQELAACYGDALKEAGRSKFVDRSAESIADEIASTYPFHPKLKTLIALFKENEKFRQTRGLIELVSRLLRSVWERKDERAFLIGAEQFDFSIAEVRNAFIGIRSMPDVIAHDIWDEHGSAIAQGIPSKNDFYAGQKIASLILASSLSTSVHAIKGLSESDILECLTSPGSDQEEYKMALQHLSSHAWYLHSTSDSKYYFDTQENLAKKLQRWAEDAPQPKVDNLKREQLRQLFTAKTKSVYQEVFALPTLDEVQESIKTQRPLIIYDPDGKIPPERIQELFSTSTKKNNFCILTGSPTLLAELDRATRFLYAIKLGENQLGKEKETEEFKERKKGAEKDFFSTLLALFNQILFPSWNDSEKQAYLRSVPIQWTRSHQNNGFDGEKELEDALSATGVAKFIPNIEEEMLQSRMERDLFEGEDRVRWADLVERSQSNTRFPWLRKGMLDDIRKKAIQKGRWEEENGWVNKKPAPKKPTVRITQVAPLRDDGTYELEVVAVHAGSSPEIYYSEHPNVPLKQRTQLNGQRFSTQKLRLYFLAVDPTGEAGEGAPVEHKGSIKITAMPPKVQGKKRLVELKALPYGLLKYTLDGSDPKLRGSSVDGALDIGSEAVTLLVYAEADGLESHWKEMYPSLGGNGETVLDPLRPAWLNLNQNNGTFADAQAWKLLAEARTLGATLYVRSVDLKDGSKTLALRALDAWETDPAHWEEAIQLHARHFGDKPILTLQISEIRFQTPQDLELLAERLQLSYKNAEVKQ